MPTRVVRNSAVVIILSPPLSAAIFLSNPCIKTALSEYPKERHKVGFNYRLIYHMRTGRSVLSKPCSSFAVFAD